MGEEIRKMDRTAQLLDEDLALKVVSRSDFNIFKLAKIAAFIQENPGSTIKDVAEKLGISYKSSQQYLRCLRKYGVVYAQVTESDSVFRYYPNPHKEEFFKLVSSLMNLLTRIKAYLGVRG
jgi:predicted transcriptional regulator